MGQSETTEEWSMQYDDKHTFPFVEDENCNITGYGHQDPAEFAAAINDYDTLCSGGPLPEDEQWTADDVGHCWVTIGEDGERLNECKEDAPGAIPVTTLWGLR